MTLLVLLLLCEAGDVADDWCEIGRSVQLDLGKAGAVGGDDARDAVAIRIGGVKVDVKLVRRLAHRWKASSKSNDGELFVCVVIFDDFSNCRQGLLVQRRTAVDVVQRSGRVWITV